MSEPITSDMIIRDVRDRYPGITAVFQAHGLPCAGCQVGSYETIAGGARTHRLDLTAILDDLNAFATSGALPAGKGRAAPALAQAPRRSETKIEGVKNIVDVVSGKGGVGKSLVTALLAVTLTRRGYKVGILDGDITGPSIPLMFGVPIKSLRQEPGQTKPVPPRSRGGIPVMSMNVLLDDPEAAVIWRGPMISGAIRQFYTDMYWGDLDYLLIDLPPGTSDAPMTVMQQLPTDGAVIVSTPQGLAAMVVSKAIQMVKKFEVPIVGIVENMSYIDLPDGTPFELFGPSQGQRLVALTGAPLLGRLPIDPRIAALCDDGRIEEYESEPFSALAQNLMTRLEQRDERPALPVISSRSLAGAARTPLPPRAGTATAPRTSQDAPPPQAAAAVGAANGHATPVTGDSADGKNDGTLSRLGRLLKRD